MVKLTLLLVLIAMSNTLQAAQKGFIQLALESDTVYMHSSVILDVVSIGVGRDLSLTPLDALPFARRETEGARLRIINGEWVEYATRRIELMPTAAGVFTIGPLVSGDIVSNTLELTVLERNSEQWLIPESELQFTSSLSTLTPYAQQMLVFEAEFQYRHHLVSPHFEIPEFDGFRVIEDQVAQPVGGADGWRRVQWRYLLFPEISGTLEIPPLSARGKMAKPGWTPVDFERQTAGYRVAVRAPSIHDGWWLPARHLHIEDSWSRSPPELVLGEPLRRQLRITAEGVTASQLPDVMMVEPEGVALRQLEKKRHDKLVDGALIATYEIEYELIPDSTDPVYIDTIQLPWWRTDVDQNALAILPPRQLRTAPPQRSDPVDALTPPAHPRESVRQTHQQPLPTRSTAILWGLLAISGAYLLWVGIMHRVGRGRTCHRSVNRRLIQALKSRRLETVTRQLNHCAEQGLLTAEGEQLQQRLNTACLEPDPAISAADWQQWLSAARRFKLIVTTCRPRSPASLPTL